MTGIFDDPRNAQADDLAFRAERAERSGDQQEARRLYGEAATLETDLAAAVPAHERRTRSLYALAAAVLSRRADDRDRAAVVASRFLADETHLTTEAVSQLREILRWASPAR